MRTGGCISFTISRRGSARPWCALASRARSSTSIAIHPARRSIPARRRPGCVRRRLSTASRCICRAPRRMRARLRRGAKRHHAPYHAALTAEIARLRAAASRRRALRLPLDPLARAAPVRWRAAELQHRHERRRELRAAADGCRRSGLRCHDYSRVTNGRFKGGYITRHYGRPAARRACDSDGARLPRLPRASPSAPIGPDRTGRCL